VKRLLIGGLLFVMVGCGGGGSEVESLDDLGAMLEDQGIDCSDLANDSDEIMVREGGRCGDYAVYVFNDSENRDNYLEIAEGFGGGPYVVGENWVVQAPDQSEAESLASDLEAEVR
jgi:hypothetical protein